MNIKFVKKIVSTNTMIFVAAIIASMGTIPYSYHFAQNLSFNKSLVLVIGCLFSLSAMIGNIALTFNSLFILNGYSNRSFIITMLSIMSAIPLGIMSYYAYNSYFPMVINLTFSLIVMLINYIIGCAAISNLAITIQMNNSLSINKHELVMRKIGFIIGLCVSLAAYVATAHGLTLFSEFMHLNKYLVPNIIYFICIIIWIPFAALYSNSTQITLGHIYQRVISKQREISPRFVFIILIAICSGASFTQIAIDFFNPAMHMPYIFKYPVIQNIIYSLLIPLTFLSSIAVNFLALNNVFKNMMRQT